MPPVDPSINRPVDISQSTPPPPTFSAEGVKVPPQAPPGAEDAFNQFSQALSENFGNVKELVTEIANKANLLEFQVGQQIGATALTETAERQYVQGNQDQTQQTKEKEVEKGDRYTETKSREDKNNLGKLFENKNARDIQKAYQEYIAGEQRLPKDGNQSTKDASVLQNAGKQEVAKQQDQLARGPQKQTGTPEQQKTSAEAALRQPQLTPQLKADIKKYEGLQKQIAELRDQLQQKGVQEKSAKENSLKSQLIKLEADVSKLKIALELGGVLFNTQGKVDKKSKKDAEEVKKAEKGEETEETSKEGDSSSKNTKQIAHRYNPVRSLQDGVRNNFTPISGDEKSAKSRQDSLGLEAIKQGLVTAFTHAPTTVTANAVQLDQQGQEGDQGNLGRRGKNQQEPVEFGSLASQAKLDGWGQVQTSGAPVTVAILGPDRKIRNLYQRENVPPEVAEAMKGLAGVRQYIQARAMAPASDGNYTSGMMVK